ncbi:MAG: MbcA/ParS/Xre antitoxin family protein [Bryobacteraceae bacterium]
MQKRSAILDVKLTEKVSTAQTIDQLIARTTEVLGSRDEAMRWLGTPVRALDFARPIYILRTPGGAEQINQVLGQMEHGIW